MAQIQKAVFTLLASFLFFSFSYGNAPLDIAKRYLQKEIKNLRLTDQDVSNYLVYDHYTSAHNGVTHVYFKQTHNGIEVHNSIININVLPNGEILNVGNRFVQDLANKVNSSTPGWTMEQAVRKIQQHYHLPGTNEPLTIKDTPNEYEAIFHKEGIALEPVKVKLVYQPMPDQTVRLAWNVKLYTLDAQNWYNTRIDAITGELLNEHNQVVHCDFGAPDANCSSHSHKQQLPAPFLPHSETNGNAANTYNVYPIKVESPNHGPRSIETNPIDVTASPFGWHDTNGTAGAEYTITRGNNTHAYNDIFDNNSSIGDEPDGGASLDFNFPINLASNSPYTYVDGAVTNLFYWCNIMHDVWYRYGYDEVSGNFQVNNYGNGGIAADHVRAEAMDGSGTNNANFGTDEDGSSARVQMYLWTSDPLPTAPAQTLTITAPSSIANDYDMLPAQFGATLPSPPLTGLVVEADDGVAPNSDACTSLSNGAAINGNIALIDRGNCEFGVKSLEAQNNGAIAVIICGNNTDPIFPMGPGAVGASVTIPCIMVSQADCATIRVELANGIQAEIGASATNPIPMPGPSGVTGDLDNGIIVHEYTHGISIRLTGGPGTGSCLSNAEQAGEGWSDWFALVMTTNATHSGGDRRGIGTYATNEPITGTGIRTYPYSTDMTIDPHTYADINNESVPHGVGSVWCVAIWDLYWRLVDDYGYDPDLYTGTGGNNLAMQLVLDGLKLQSCNPTFIDARDAIIAADLANNGGANECLIWEVFARRGIGYSATAGGNEAFDKAPSCSPTLKLAKTAEVEVPAGDVINYTFVVTNDVPTPLTGVTVLDTLPAGVTFVAGSGSCANTTINGNVVSIPIGTMNTGDVATCTFQVTSAAAPFTVVSLEDDMESGGANWESTIGTGAVMWGLDSSNPNSGTMAWYAEDIDSESDQYLTLKTPITISGVNPALTFWHYYDTESTWDGGVIEISSDQGASWSDLENDIIKNGYNNQLEVNPASPISGQRAFTGKSAGYIETIVDLTNYLGMDVQVRFRLGCDGFVGADGWYIDDVKFLDLVAITNSACVVSNEGDTACDDATTTITEPVSSITPLSELLDVSIYPNPVDELLNIEFNTALIAGLSWNLLAVDGKQILSGALESTGSGFTLNVAELPAGVYLLQFRTDDGTSIHKVIIE